MSKEIQTTNNQVQISEPKAHILLNEPAFKLKEATVFNKVLVEVAKSYLHLGWKQPADHDLNIMISELTKNIQDKYKQLRIEELPDAFSNGIRKEYGEYMGLSVVTFEMFIKGYLNSRYRSDLAKSIPAIEAPKEPTREEKFNLARYNAISAFLSYQNQKDITLVAPSVYRFLRKLNLLSYEEAEQAEFIEQATKEVKEDLVRQQATVIDKYKRLEIGRQLENSQTMEQKIIIQAQRLGLYAYFQELIMEETDLKELLDTKKQHIF